MQRYILHAAPGHTMRCEWRHEPPLLCTRRGSVLFIAFTLHTAQRHCIDIASASQTTQRYHTDVTLVLHSHHTPCNGIAFPSQRRKIAPRSHGNITSGPMRFQCEANAKIEMALRVNIANVYGGLKGRQRGRPKISWLEHVSIFREKPLGM